jgi:hypothetical protein
MPLPFQVVVARYQEDIGWAESLPAIIYNKGPLIDTAIEQRPLPNVGREAHTYLHHILHHWHDLADLTLFAQGNTAAHLPSGVVVSDFFQPNADIVVPWLVRLREWLPDGRLWFGDEWRWREKLETGVIQPAKLTMTEWFKQLVGVDVADMDALAYTPGAIFAVRRDLVHRRPRAYYEAIIRTLMHHTSPEEAYFCEQAWMYMFANQDARIQLLTVPANPNAVRA